MTGKQQPASSAREPAADDDTYLPPRKAVHPSEKGKWTRRFYLTLLWLFVLLVVALLAWGIRSEHRTAPPEMSTPATNVSAPLAIVRLAANRYDRNIEQI
jgi:hypothetical protein